MRSHKFAAWLAIAVLLTAIGCQRPPKPSPIVKPATPSRTIAAQAEENRARQFPELRPAAAADDQVARNLAEGKQPYSHLMGYQPQPQQSERFLRSLPQPTLRQANPQLFRPRGPPPANEYAADQPVLLYRALNAAHLRKFGEPWKAHRQEIGDCVSHGWALACEIALALDYVQGTGGDFEIVATEPLYGLSRVEGRNLSYNRSGDGSYGAAAAAGVTKFGLPFRLDYRSVASSESDLRIYSGSRARNWGAWGCGGKDDRGRLDTIAKLHAVRQVALVETWEETKAAIVNGYAIAVCSGQGFAYATDADGFARASGSWPHCMCAVGIRFDREGVLIANSWGDFIDQTRGKFPTDMPKGCFWCDRRTWEGMIRGRDTYAVSTVVGFPPRKLSLVEGL